VRFFFQPIALLLCLCCGCTEAPEITTSVQGQVDLQATWDDFLGDYVTARGLTPEQGVLLAEFAKQIHIAFEDTPEGIPITFGFDFKGHLSDDPSILHYYRPVGTRVDEVRADWPGWLEKARSCGNAFVRTDAVPAAVHINPSLNFGRFGSRWEINLTEPVNRLDQLFQQALFVIQTMKPTMLHFHVVFPSAQAYRGVVSTGYSLFNLYTTLRLLAQGPAGVLTTCQFHTQTPDDVSKIIYDSNGDISGPCIAFRGSAGRGTHKKPLYGPGLVGWEIKALSDPMDVLDVMIPALRFLKRPLDPVAWHRTATPYVATDVTGLYDLFSGAAETPRKDDVAKVADAWGAYVQSQGGGTALRSRARVPMLKWSGLSLVKNSDAVETASTNYEAEIQALDLVSDGAWDGLAEVISKWASSTNLHEAF